MENGNGEQQVWQRVFAQREAQPEGGLRELILAAMELAGTYRYLAGQLTGKQREKAMGLYESQRETVACLKGLGILSGRGDEVLKIWNPEKEPGRKLLEKCYYRNRRCMVEYAARSAEPECGVVFQSLADRAGKQCARIVELLGSMP